MTQRVCEGYGKRKGRCQNPAGGPWSPWWCKSCDTDRVQAIVKRFPDLKETFYGKRKATKAQSNH